MRRIDTSSVRIPGTNLRGGRAIAVGLVGLYVLLFILLNRRRVEVNFVFFKIRGNELLALIVVLALGFAAGFVVRGRRQGASPGNGQPATRETSTEPERAAAAGRGDGPEAGASDGP